MSVEDFKEAADVIQTAISEKTFADLKYLEAHVGAEKLKSSEYKFAYRTLYKALLGESFPAKKPANVTEAMFTKQQAHFDKMMKNGAEVAYNKIADAVKTNPDQAIKDFHI